jgi:hypothetical protein
MEEYIFRQTEGSGPPPKQKSLTIPGANRQPEGTGSGYLEVRFHEIAWSSDLLEQRRRLGEGFETFYGYIANDLV